MIRQKTNAKSARVDPMLLKKTQIQSLFAFLLPLRYDFSPQDFGMIRHANEAGHRADEDGCSRDEDGLHWRQMAFILSAVSVQMSVRI